MGPGHFVPGKSTATPAIEMHDAPNAEAVDIVPNPSDRVMRSAGHPIDDTLFERGAGRGRFRARSHALWNHRSFIASMVRRDFATRYVGSLFGALWSVANPLALILIYTLVFSRVMHTGMIDGGHGPYGYGVFLCAGLLPWLFFIDTLTRCLTIFLEHRGLLKHQAFPRVALPVVVLISTAIQFGITYSLLLIFLLLSGEWPGWTLAGVLPLLVLQQGIAVGLGVALGTLNVYFRDSAQAMSVVLQFWFWLTPVVYPQDILSPFALSVLRVNPMYWVVTGYQILVFSRTWPPWTLFVWPAGAAAGCLLLGWVVYRRLGREMVDEL